MALLNLLRGPLKAPGSSKIFGIKTNTFFESSKYLDHNGSHRNVFGHPNSFMAPINFLKVPLKAPDFQINSRASTPLPLWKPWGYLDYNGSHENTFGQP